MGTSIVMYTTSYTLVRFPGTNSANDMCAFHRFERLIEPGRHRTVEGFMLVE